MLGRATAGLERPPRSWLRRVWGVADIHDRQKWSAVWPTLAGLRQSNLRLLDAGCAAGGWTLELARSRPGWTIVGVDNDRDAIAAAEKARRRLALDNVSFVEADFLTYHADTPFDVVLSVSSAHYLAEQGSGDELFQRFAAWLWPAGQLILLGPRSAAECWFAPGLYRPPGRAVFSAAELARLCRLASLEIVALEGRIGPLATLAKQLAWGLQRRSVALSRLGYPVLWTLGTLDRLMDHRDARGTMMWLLTARAPAAAVTASQPRTR